MDSPLKIVIMAMKKIIEFCLILKKISNRLEYLFLKVCISLKILKASKSKIFMGLIKALFISNCLRTLTKLKKKKEKTHTEKMICQIVILRPISLNLKKQLTFINKKEKKKQKK